MEQKPDILSLETSAEFLRWYWLKTDLQRFCRHHCLSITGRKFDIQDRIVAFLDGVSAPIEKKKKPSSSFNWAKDPLFLDTQITDSITFGKHFRSFMTDAIGKKFVCHSDFMAWVKTNIGATLEDAIVAWQMLENRKLNPEFRRVIAPQNMLIQYARDFFDDNPELTQAQMMTCWRYRKSQPVTNGTISYKPTDIKYLS